MSMQFETINLSQLTQVTGADGKQAQAQPQPQTPSPHITTQDVVNTTGHAIKSVLAPTTVLGNLGQAYHQFNDPRVGTRFTDRLAYGFTGLFGIDPLKN